jgi:hypothetical protein
LRASLHNISSGAPFKAKGTGHALDDEACAYFRGLIIEVVAQVTS